MSRYPPPTDYRGFRERSRSPPRFSDRRGSTTSLFPPRNADPPRGPRQFDGPPARQSISGAPGLGPASRPGFSSLRDAPPLGSIGGAERDRPFRVRDFDRPPRIPSPRERSPPRGFKDPRDYPPSELDIPRARRASRERPPSAGSAYSDNPPFASGPSRGDLGRGCGRGDFEFRGGRGGRGGRRDFEERDRELFRREKSPPPPRWARDLSRDGREPERRDDRRFVRREEERRPEWYDRERDLDRSRRDQLAPRLETRRSDESIASAPAPPQASQALQIDPGRLALLEQAGVDLSVRGPSVPQNVPPPREVRRELPETPSYLNGRAENTANRYNQRGSSPPTQAPPVPAFTLSFAPSAPPHSLANNPAPAPVTKSPEIKAPTAAANDQQRGSLLQEARNNNERPLEIERQAQASPAASKVEPRESIPEAPSAPRALEIDSNAGAGSRLHGVRSLETFQRPTPSLNVPRPAQADPFVRSPPSGPRAVSPAVSVSIVPTPVQPASQNTQATRFGELSAPKGPRATRMSPALASVSPRPPFASPRSDAGGFQGFAGFSRGQTPPPAAPSGPRNRSFSVSPKVTSFTVPTAPRGSRGPPLAPRAVERGSGGAGRGVDRFGAQFGAQPPWAQPTAPKGLQWNQWRRPVPASYGDKLVPIKRDFSGEEKERQPESGAVLQGRPDYERREQPGQPHAPGERSTGRTQAGDRMEIDHEPVQRSQQPSASDYSARQSFFGKPEEPVEDDISMSEAADEPISSSEEDDLDPQQDLALFKAKFERQKRGLEAQIVDLSARQYRATTPRESIARLSRLSEKDLQRAQEHHEMDVDESPPAADNHLMPPTTHSSGTEEGPDLLTPKGEEEAAVEVRSSGESSDNVRRMRRPSPEVISLPYLVKEPREFQDVETLHETIQRQEDSKAAVIVALQQEANDERAAEESEKAEFEKAYDGWRQQCEELDRYREEQERLERQMSVDPGPEMLPPVAPPINPIAEGRRLHKNSSEYEIEQVLKQSEATARLEQEKHERESRKMQADMEKEAKVADQQREASFKRSIFIDANRLREPDMLTLVFSYEPQPDTFTENEQQIFIAASKETPKKWGEISSLLPGRTYRDCIHHYYANKWDGRFRDNRTKKLKAGGRRGRGGKATRGRGGGAMADMAATEELLPPLESGRPRRAAAPTTFGEREVESKAALINPSLAKKLGPVTKQDANGEAVTEKPGKRRKGLGEKPGRKAKTAQQPLAALAAAPTASPNKQFLQGMHTKEDFARAQSLEDATLLAGLQSGHHSMLPAESQAVYHHEEFASSMLPSEDTARMKTVGQTPGSRSGASSYWSVPEQQDFVKHIGHFGTDFAAIADHMGTKTHTMIKNHYTRQVSNGNQPELEIAARDANRRRENGEDMGPPPTPTPIIKRKYDQPQPTAPRTLAPHTDAMEIDEAVAPQRQPQPKHVSPHQYQVQPRFTMSAQSTPIPAQRVIPSPVTTTASPAMPKVQTPAPPRPMPHPLGAGLAFTTESRPESRPGLSASTVFRHSAGSIPRSQAQQQQSGQVPDARFMEQLIEERNRALRIEQVQSQQERHDPLPRPPSFQRGSAHGSPPDQPLFEPIVERKPLIDDRAPTPPRASFATTPFARPLLGASTLGTFRSTPFSLMGQSPMNASPAKEEPGPSSVLTVTPTQPSVSSVLAPPPEPPKRSNLLSILNDELDEPKPPKRDSLPSFQQRVPSPVPPSISNAPTPAPTTNPHPLRRETFGQPSMPQSSFHRTSCSQQGSLPGAAPSAIKQEHSGAALPTHAPKPDWAARVLGQPPQSNVPSQPSPPLTLEREVRPYFSHRAALRGLNQPGRANPSPPPHTVMAHSRTPSLTMQPTQPPREQRRMVPSQQGQHNGHGAVQALHSNPYAKQPTGPPFSKTPQPEARNHSHHSHNSSLSGGFPTFHHRAHSREDAIRQEQQAFAAQRDREDLERRRREAQAQEDFRQREAHQREAHFYAQQRQQEEDRERERRQQMFARDPPPPPQPMQPPAFNGPAFAQGRFGASLRDQALRETEAAMRQQEELRIRDDVRLLEQRERQLSDEHFRKRQQQQEDVLFRRQTSLGGNYGHAPPRR